MFCFPFLLGTSPKGMLWGSAGVTASTARYGCQAVTRGPAPSSHPQFPTSVHLPTRVIKVRLCRFAPRPSLTVCPVQRQPQSLIAGGLLRSSCGWDAVAFSSSFVFVVLHQLISCVKSWLIFKWSAKLSLQRLWSGDQSIFANLSLNGDTVCIIIMNEDTICITIILS